MRLMPVEPFQTTIWSEIHRAKEKDPKAYLRFVNRYRPPVVSFLEWLSFSREDAEDLAQEVFLSILRTGVLARADPSVGQFRSLLLGVTRHIATSELRRRTAEKRGGKIDTIPIDQAVEPAQEAAEAEVFDRLWAKQLVSLALQELARENANYYRALHLQLEGLSYPEIAKQMEKSVAEVTNYIHRAREWTRRAVQRLVAEYCPGEDSRKRELEHLSKFGWKPGRVEE